MHRHSLSWDSGSRCFRRSRHQRLALVLDGIRSGDRGRVRVRFCRNLLYLGFAAAQQTVDVSASIPAIVFLFAFPIAHLDATRTIRGRDRFGLQRGAALRVVLAGSVVMALVWLGWSERSATAAERSVAEANMGLWQEAFDHASEAHAGDPGLPLYSFNLGVAASRVGEPEIAKTAFLDAATVDDLLSDG